MVDMSNDTERRFGAMVSFPFQSSPRNSRSTHQILRVFVAPKRFLDEEAIFQIRRNCRKGQG